MIPVSVSEVIDVMVEVVQAVSDTMDGILLSVSTDVPFSPWLTNVPMVRVCDT